MQFASLCGGCILFKAIILLKCSMCCVDHALTCNLSVLCAIIPHNCFSQCPTTQLVKDQEALTTK